MIEILRGVYYVVGIVAVAATAIMGYTGRDKDRERSCENCELVERIWKIKVDGVERNVASTDIGCPCRYTGFLMLDDDYDGDKYQKRPQYCSKWEKKKRNKR